MPGLLLLVFLFPLLGLAMKAVPCLHFEKCTAGLKDNRPDFPNMLEQCLKYNPKLTPAQVSSGENGIQEVYLDVLPTIVSSTFDSGGQVISLFKLGL